MFISLDRNRLGGSGEGDSPVLRQCPGRERRDNFRRNVLEIDSPGHIKRNRIETRDPQQLLHDPVHARDIGPQFGQFLVALHRVEHGGDDGKRRAQLVGGIGGDFALNRESLLQPVECAIDGGDERRDFGGQVLVRQADVGRRRSRCARQCRRFRGPV
jgi:hypothetical protein